MALIVREAENVLALSQTAYVEQGTSLNLYGSVMGANLFFSNLLEGERWAYLPREKQIKCLNSATRRIDQLNFAGCRSSESQALQFPRGTDTLVPVAVEEATYWLALALSAGVNPDTERDNALMTTQVFGALRTEYDRGIAPIHIVNGIPCPTAWALLQPFLVENRGLQLRRV